MKTHVFPIFLLFDCQVFGNKLRTQFFMANSSVKIGWTVVWFKFNSLAIIRTVNRRSYRTRATTITTLLSVFQVEGLAERGPSLMDSRPSENVLNHLNTCDLDKTCSPKTCFSLLKVSIPVSPSLTQNLIAHLCSKLRSPIAVTHTHKLLHKKPH